MGSRKIWSFWLAPKGRMVEIKKRKALLRQKQRIAVDSNPFITGG